MNVYQLEVINVLSAELLSMSLVAAALPGHDCERSMPHIGAIKHGTVIHLLQIAQKYAPRCSQHVV